MKEVEAIGNWLVANKSFEDIEAQYRHFDEQPDRCPFLAPDKSCFIYQVRPTVCVMFGHLADTPGLPKHVSQLCPEGVNFTLLTFRDVAEEAMDYFVEMGNHARMLNFRFAPFECDDGKTHAIKPKEGTKMHRILTAKSCFRCNAEFPKGGRAYFEEGELLCQTCEDNYKPKVGA